MALRSLLFLGAASTALAAPGLFQRSAELPTISASAVPVAVIDDAPKPTLEPVTPPVSNPEDLDILTPNQKVSLFYKSRPVITKRDGNVTEDATLAELDFKFQYPSIPLDHSSFVTTVICGTEGLKATFSDPTGFDYAESSWPKDSKLILITSTSGCGPNDQNGLFLADSVAFFDDSVSATGSFVEVHDIMDTLNIQWGKLSLPAQSNGLNSTSTDYGCPTCGPDFDGKLDGDLGYYSGDQASIMSKFAPGTSNSTSSDLHRRGILDDIGDAIGDAVDTIGDTISDGVGTIVDGAGDIIDGVGDAIGDVVDGVIEFTGEVIDGITDALDGDYSKTVTLDIDVFAHYLNDVNYANELPGNMASSSDGEAEEEEEHEAPWENSYLLFSWGAPEKEEGDTASSGSETSRNDAAPALQEREVSKGLNLYCVDCGVKGSVSTTGSISLTLAGIDECKISVNGNLEAGLFLGLEMFIAFEEKYEKDLIKKSLLGWEIPGIIIFGPYASLGVEAGVEIKAEGTVLLGAKVEWTGFEATLDLLDADKSTQSGWTPDVTRKFEAEGKIGVEASLGLPVAVGVGVDLLGGKWKKGIELKDTPAIVAEATFEVSVKHESTTGADGTETSDSEVDVNDGCYGVAWNIKLKNELVVAVTDVDEWPLIPEWESDPLAEGCIGYQEPEEDDEGGDEEGSDESDGGGSGSDGSADGSGDGSGGEENGGSDGEADDGTGSDGTGEDGSGDDGNDDGAVGEDGAEEGESGSGEEGSDEDGSGGDGNGSDGSGSDSAGSGGEESDGSNDDDSNGDGSGEDPSGSDGGSGDDDTGSGGTPGEDSGDGTTTPPTPTPHTCKGWVYRVPTTLAGSAICHERRGRFKPGGRARIGKPFPQANNKACARSCINSEECEAFAFNPPKKLCTLFRKSVQELSFASGTMLKVNDVGCFQTRDCPVSPPPPLRKRADDEAVQTAQVTDLSGSYRLVPTEDGNIQVVAVNDTASPSSFATLDGLIVGDSKARILHYYPETMADVGVSRLRLGPLDTLPQTSEFVALAPLTVDGTEILVAVDTEGQASYPVVCAIAGVGTKVFLVADVYSAEEKLSAENLRNEVTGGVVQKCVALALTVR